MSVRVGVLDEKEVAAFGCAYQELAPARGLTKPFLAGAYGLGTGELAC